MFFPTHTVTRVEYPEPGGMFTYQKVLKLRIDMAYDKYKFFTVETESNVKKWGLGMMRGAISYCPRALGSSRLSWRGDEQTC